MKLRTLGSSGLTVSAIGMGCMQLSVMGRPSEEQSIATVQAALEQGITLFDTADAYCLDSNEVGHNERILAKTLKNSNAIAATKGGHIRPDARWDVDGRPEHLRAACEASIRALEVDSIVLYQFHRPDPKVPYAESIGALADLQREGKIVHVGISNVSVSQLEEALRQVKVISVQNEMNLFNNSSAEVLRRCEELGIAFLPYSPLRGKRNAGKLGDHEVLARIASKYEASAQQIALAWLLQRSPVMIPIPGASRSENIMNCAGAPSIVLSSDDMQELNRLSEA